MPKKDFSYRTGCSAQKPNCWSDDFIDSFFVAVSEIDDKGRMTYLNKAGMELLHMTEEELAKRPYIKDLVHPKELAHWEHDWNALLKGEHLERTEYMVQRKDGSLAYATGKIIPFVNEDGKPFYRTTFVDITPHRELEQKLRKSEERYALVSKGANDGMWDWDVELDQVYFSTRYKEILGYTDEEFSNDAEEWRSRVHPDDFEKVLEANKACINGEVPQFEVEYRMRHKNGSWVWILGRGAGLADSSGKVVRLAGTHTDISRNKQAANALRVSEELHSALSRATFEAVIILEGGVCVAANEAACKVFGYPLTAMIGLGPSAFVVRNDQAALRKRVFEGIEEPFEATGVRQNGSTFFAEFRNRSFRFRGSRARVLAVRDITRRKQAEQHYRDIFENAMEGVYQSSPNGTFLTVNPSFAEMLGYESPEDMLQSVQNISQDFYADPEMRDVLLDRLVDEKNVHAFEVRVKQKDGTPIWLSESVRAVFNDAGEFLYYEGFAQDITERKNNEQISSALYRISRAINSTADLDDLYGTIHDTLRTAIHAPNFYIARVYPEDNRLSFSYFQDERDTSYDLFNINDPDVHSITLDVIRSGTTKFMLREEMEALTQSGSTQVIGVIPEVWLGVPLKLRGEVIGAMAVQDYDNPNQYSDADVLFLESVSEQIALAIERKSNEERIIRLNETLESKVEARTRELQRQTAELEAANKRLQELDKLKSSLISSISHELRTPLTSIRGFAKLVARDISRKLKSLAYDDKSVQLLARMVENLSIIESEGERLTRLINDFLDLSRIESGKTVWNSTRFNPARIIRQTAESIAGQLDETEIGLQINVPDELSEIYMDEDRLRQVLMNLLNNAAKFTDRGSISVEACNSDGKVQVVVSDTGIGITPQHLPHVFERFHKASEGDTVARSEGTGLGLAICKEIVEYFGGTIHVESEPGKGSRFTVSLPKAE